MKAIEAVGLTKRYKDITAVDHLTFSVEEGELFALLGVNGAGKSTTVKMLSCLLAPTEGDALLHGISVVGDGQSAKQILAVSPQETAVAPNLTTEENLRLMAGLHGFSKEKQEAKLKELTETFDLKAVLFRRAGKLSGGWQRRLSIAMAMVSEPKLLFLDEPTLGLDVIVRSDLWKFIRGLKGKMTVILTTHYMEEAEALSDRIGIMKEGRLIDAVTAAEWKRRTGCDRFEDAFIAAVKEAKT